MQFGFFSPNTVLPYMALDMLSFKTWWRGRGGMRGKRGEERSLGTMRIAFPVYRCAHTHKHTHTHTYTHTHTQTHIHTHTHTHTHTSAVLSSDAFTSCALYPQWLAIMWARVVFPVPGGPARRITFWTGRRSAFFRWGRGQGVGVGVSV